MPLTHEEFKAKQTAAVYVANGLSESVHAAFETHRQVCADCASDVEAWRAIKDHRPARPDYCPEAYQRTLLGSRWKAVALLLAGTAIAGIAGWVGSAVTSSDLSVDRVVVFPLSAGRVNAGDCNVVLMTPDTHLALTRIVGLSGQMHLVVLDSEQRELRSDFVGYRMQPDGSYLLRLDARAIIKRAVHLEAQMSDGTHQALGCVTGQVL